MNARSFRCPRFRWVPTILLVAAALTSRSARADGVACEQICGEKGCSQTTCGEAVSSAGFCLCQSAALPWAGVTYSSWCRVSGPAKTSARCPADTSGRQLSPNPAGLSSGFEMAKALAGRNPYVATLIDALQQSGGWVAGPVQGLIHDSHYDESTGELSHGTAVPFSGSVTTGGLDAAQIQLTVDGDLRQLAHLRLYVDSILGAAVPPSSVRGTVTERGLHGSLLVVGLDGLSEAIQW